MKDLTDTKLYFWPYDIFGYLLPGFVVMIPLIEFNTRVRGLFTERFSETSILDVEAIVGVAYTLGHIVAALSSLVLERFVLKFSHGYPGTQVFVIEPARRPRWKAFILFFFPGHCHPYPPQFIRRYFLLYNITESSTRMSTLRQRPA